MGKRTAVYRPFAQAVPNKVVIDDLNCIYLKGLAGGKDLCRLCQKGIEKKGLVGCETGAIDFSQKDEIIDGQHAGQHKRPVGLRAYTDTPHQGGK